MAEIDGTLTDVQTEALARRHGLGACRIAKLSADRRHHRPVSYRQRPHAGCARGELAADASIRSVQPNFRYVLQDQAAAVIEGDPAQYALAKLRLPQAHTLARGAGVTIAVIDSGIDVKHPELADAIAATFDALGSTEGPHLHGTGIAGAIVAHARLMEAHQPRNCWRSARSEPGPMARKARHSSF